MRYAIASALALLAASGFAQADDKVVKIGVLNDQSSLYADDRRQRVHVLAAQMAVEDSGLDGQGLDDQRHRPATIRTSPTSAPASRANGSTKTRSTSSPTCRIPASALAVNNVVKEKNGVYLNSGAATSDLTGKACSPNTVHWTYDTYMLAHGTGAAVVKAGGDTWFFLTADYAFGKALQRDTTDVIEATGGKVRRLGQRAAQYARLLVLPAAGAGLEGQGGRPRQCRRRHRSIPIKQAHEFGARVGRPEARRAAAVRHRRQRARSRGRARACSSPRPSTGT